MLKRIKPKQFKCKLLTGFMYIFNKYTKLLTSRCNNEIQTASFKITKLIQISNPIHTVTNKLIMKEFLTFVLPLK